MTASSRGTDGKLFVDCTECVRGANGERDCSSGWMHKKTGYGCFSGELLPGVEVA